MDLYGTGWGASQRKGTGGGGVREHCCSLEGGLDATLRIEGYRGKEREWGGVEERNISPVQ